MQMRIQKQIQIQWGRYKNGSDKNKTSLYALFAFLPLSIFTFDDAKLSRIPANDFTKVNFVNPGFEKMWLILFLHADSQLDIALNVEIRLAESWPALFPQTFA